MCIYIYIYIYIHIIVIAIIVINIIIGFVLLSLVYLCICLGVVLELLGRLVQVYLQAADSRLALHELLGLVAPRAPV